MWQKQSQQILITSQYSQKQAEELKEELRQREERARVNKQKILEDRMKNMQGQNQNARGAVKDNGKFTGMWNKILGKSAA